MRYVVSESMDRWLGDFYTLVGEARPDGKQWWQVSIEERHHPGAEGIIRRCPRMRGHLTVWLLQDARYAGKLVESALVIGTECTPGNGVVATEIASGLFDEIFDTFAAYVRMLVP